MNIKKIIDELSSCSCGKTHTADLQKVEIGRGLLQKTAEILKESHFPKNILLVADNNTLNASGNIVDILSAGGFHCIIKLFDDLRVADMRDVDILVEQSNQADAILSVGSGSLNDICRLAALKADKRFAIFATAPSMDGFASNSSPITKGNFKISYAARCPEIIISDTEILAKAPMELKSAGFGDMIAKYIAVADWKISNLTTGEYYCENIANLTREALAKVVSMADNVTSDDPETAGAIMEALVLSGLTMSLAGCSRPASGAEHIISHFWEIKKLENGQTSDFHGKKVGVASLIIIKLYHLIAQNPNINIQNEVLDWDDIYRAYGPNFREDIEKMNNPTITTKTNTVILNACWADICKIIKEELPEYNKALDLMHKAGAVTSISEIGVSHQLAYDGIKYHPYMRNRMNLTRLIPMLIDNETQEELFKQLI